MPSIEQWLEGLGLGRYARLFVDNDIDLSLLTDLNDADLEKLGVVSMGHRKRLLAAIAALPSDGPRVPAEPIEAARPRGEAERRQLTVMFCDMVGSTALSTRTDPEDYREIVQGYQDICAGIVTRFGGFVAQFMGDGVLAYFGWPRAHEDDAARAISGALDLVLAVGGLSANGDDKAIAVRVGIATGPVVIGDIVGEGASQEAAATGETLNLASRLQALADANAVVISAETRALAGGVFDYAALGPQTLKGIDGTPEVWRVVGQRRVETRFAAAHGRELTPLIGRDEELELLLRRWQRARDGNGQLVLLAGEPGIGKSRLVRALRDAIADAPRTRLIYQCSPHHTSSALYPVISQLEHAAEIETGDGTDARLDKLERLLAQAGRPTGEIMPLIASLLSIPAGERYPLPDLPPQQLKDRTLTALIEQLVGHAEQQPVLLVFEDAHWIDPTSLELMELVTHRIKDLPVLVIVTYRPEFAAPWVGLPHVTLQALNRLDGRECAAMVGKLAGASELPTELLEQLVAKTDGVPLFVEELTRSVLESRTATAPARSIPPTDQAKAIVIPATLQEALGARLDRSPAVREVGQVGAAIGREFPYDLLAQVVSIEPAEIDGALDDLVASGLIFARGAPPDASYTFKHALVQDTAYESMVRAKRRETHKRIAEALVALRPQAADTEPAVLAHHTTEAGLLEEAVDWWTRAGRGASVRSANPEAVDLLERGLALIARLPESEARDRNELALQTALFGPLISVKGQFSSEWETTFVRVLELCERVDAPQEMFRALYAKALFHLFRGEHALGYQVAEDMLQRAERASDEGATLMARRMFATSLLFTGRVVEAKDQFDLMRSTFDPERHGHVMVTYGQHPGLVAEAIGAGCQWILGWPDEARSTGDRAFAQVLEIDHASTRGTVLSSLSLIGLVVSRETDRLRRVCEEFHDLTSGYRMPVWEAFYRTAHSILQSMTSPSKQAAAELRNALVHFEALTPNKAMYPNWWGKFLAESYLAVGDPVQALEVNDKGFELAKQQGEHWTDSELLRVRGEALAMRDGVEGNEEAEAFLRRAVDDARSRSAKSFELRAAMSLARFLRDQKRSAEARAVLAPIYDWFTEGFDTPDLVDARALLDELG